jgi:HlyD family secretion protein
MAEARVDAARERLALVRDETRAEDIRQAEADLASAEARLSEAEALLQKTYVRSPIDGRVLHRWRKTGESVGAAMTPILSVADTAKLRVRVDVDETDVARIREGQRAWVTADAYPGRRFTGRVVRIGQVLGRKNVRTDEPTERVDKKVLETLVDLDEGQSLPLGLRVNVFLE